jgi:hypothetical protein
MHAKIDFDNNIIQYPIINLYEQLPHISLPLDLTDNNVLPAGYVYVHNVNTLPTFNAITQKLVETTPQLVNKKWVKTYEVIDLDPLTVESNISTAAEVVRQIRNQKIKDFESRLLRAFRLQNSGMSHENIGVLDSYVQALADVPQQPGFPLNVVWPNLPN